jgi:alkanesulfonate monooxygenase SsuD/methylene tetrahydromethanopterin reductase-like flavin-dependent oxidoreductase (luciferase family)
MRIGYMIELNKGEYDQPMPGREDVHETMEAMIRQGEIAERAGFHSVLVPDRHGRTENYFPGPLQLLTILAQETEKVAIGSFTLVSTLYHPMHIAEQCAVIDNLSEGRLFMTMSRGYHEGYWKQFGIPREKLLGRFKEELEVVRLACQGERFDFHGKHFDVEDGLLVPQPYQEGGWPIWGGGNAVPAAIRRSAEYGECFTCDHFPLEKANWEERVGLYRERAEELGKKPYVVIMRDGWVGDSFEEAAATFGHHTANDMRWYWRQGMMPGHHPDFQSEEDLTPEKLRPHMVIGTAEECIERISFYEEEFGIDYLVMGFRRPTGPSLEEVEEQIQRFGEEVVSYFHKRDPAPQHPAIPAGARF